MSAHPPTLHGSARAAKAQGAFFTPPAIAQFLAEWAIRGPDDAVLEPSCGAAVFLQAAAQVAKASEQPSLFGSLKLTGIDIHKASLEAAKRVIGSEATLVHSDFFDVPSSPSFDVVIGNPPFVRYQDFAGSNREKGLRAAIRAGVNLSGLSSSWAPFLVHAASFVRDNGRLGFVLPAELLTVNYAAPVRSFLLRRFSKVRLVVFEELVFPGALEDVVLLMAEGSGGCDHFELQQVRNTEELFASGGSRWTSFSPSANQKWTQALLERDAWGAFDAASKSDQVETFDAWGRIYLGAVTGDNSYFTLSDEEVDAWGILSADRISVSPPGSRHLRGTVISTGVINELRAAGKKCWLFSPRVGRLSSSAIRYIEEGERRGVSNAYKCRVRDPWYRVPLVDTPDLLLTYMDQDRPRLVANEAKVAVLNSLYGVSLSRGRKKLGRDLLPVAFLNSLTLLGAEVLGRSYGGGMLKLEPKEANRIPLPSFQLLSKREEDLRALAPHLAVSLRLGRFMEAAERVDRVLLLESGIMSEGALAKLRDARQFLHNRRMTRSRGSG